MILHSSRLISSCALTLILMGLPLPHASAAPPGVGSSRYHVARTIALPGDEGWDYLAVDSDARRVYVSRASHVVVLDADSGSVVGDIPDTQGVHGIAIATDLGRGFTSNGRANAVTIFDLKNLNVIGTVKTGTGPDAIVYDASSKRVFTMNAQSHDATAIDGSNGSVVGTLALGGTPEFAVADGKGSVFVNIEDKSELVEFDPQKLTVMHRWPLTPCEEPSGLAMDRKNRRLFAGCGNKMMGIVNADTGRVIATSPIGQGVDANAFDPETAFAFASNGEGTITVVHEESPEKFTVVDNVPTKRSARTMGLDLKTHNIFLSAADFDAPAPGERRGKMKPHSFVLLVVTRE